MKPLTDLLAEAQDALHPREGFGDMQTARDRIEEVRQRLLLRDGRDSCDECRDLPLPPRGGLAREHMHPECRYCIESTRVNVGIMAENRHLKKKVDEVTRERDKLRGEQREAVALDIEAGKL